MVLVAVRKDKSLASAQTGLVKGVHSVQTDCSILWTRTMRNWQTVRHQCNRYWRLRRSQWKKLFIALLRTSARPCVTHQQNQVPGLVWS